MPGTPDGRDAAVRRLVASGILTEEQAVAVLAELRAADAVPAPARRGGWWMEVAGYVGGGLMLAGAATLVGVSWDALSQVGQMALLAAVSVALIAAALAIGGGPAALRPVRDGSAPGRRRVIGVLLALAAGPAALAVGVAVDNHPEVLAPAVGLAVAVSGYAWVRTVPGALAAAVLSLITVVSAGNEVTDPVLATAVGLIALGSTWIALSVGGVVVPRGVGFGIGAAIALIGAQEPIGSSETAGWAYGLTFAVAAACLALYRWQRAAVLLVAGVLGVSVAVPEAVWDWTEGAGGAAGVLLVGGAVLLAASGVGLRLHRADRPHRAAA